jgi:hypothetical protein
MAVMAQSVLYSPLGATLRLVASNATPTVSSSDPLPGLVNSYSGSDHTKWVTGIPRYGTATLAAVYPGIGAQYTIGANGNLTLNLMLAAGVDPSGIQFQIAQASKIVVNPDGTLLASIGPALSPLVPPPPLSYAAPLAFQTTALGKVSRSVSFTVQSTTNFALTVQGVDTTLPLQISIKIDNLSGSPSVSQGLSTQPVSDGAGNTFYATTIADAAGKAAPFPLIGGVGCGNQVNQPIACADVAIYKYSAAGVLNFITYLAGDVQETAGFVGLAPDGAVVVAGSTSSADFPVTASALQPTYAGPQTPFGGDYFAAKLDPVSGLLRAATFLGGPDIDTMGTAALGADGSLYFLPVARGSFSTKMPVTSGALQAACQADPCQNG